MTRHCGNCTLCCKLVPVRELEKNAGQRCRHQRSLKGCAIYQRRPLTCMLWNCAWLTGDGAADLRRPDFSHYVVDPMPDYVTAVEEDGVTRHKIPVVQVWCDPKFPTAHRDPALRAYLDKRGKDGFAAIIRYNASDGFVLFPPPMTGGEWIENERTSVAGDEHSQADIADVLTKATGEVYGIVTAPQPGRVTPVSHPSGEANQ